MTTPADPDFILQAHTATAVPSVWILYALTMVVLLVCGLFIARRSAKYWGIFFLTLVVVGMLTYGIAHMPNVVQVIWEFVVGTGVTE